MPFPYANLPCRPVRRPIFSIPAALCGIALLSACGAGEPTGPSNPAAIPDQYIVQFQQDVLVGDGDRKSTRLNSSH